MPNFTRASDDLENPDKIRTLLKDLREARQAKSRDGLKTLDHSELSVRFALNTHVPRYIADADHQLPNLCSMEINEIRPFFVQSMSVLAKFQLDRENASAP
jgi:GINS complex subunit 2